MGIKLKLSEVIVLNNVLKEIMNDNKIELDALFKFKLLGIIKALEKHITNFETIRNEKIMVYGKETKDGSISIPAEDKDAISKFNDSLKELIQNEVTIHVDKLKAADVLSKELSTEYLMILYPIMEE